MWELGYEGWAPKNWYFWTVLEKTPKSPLDCKKIKSVNNKENQPWIFIGRTDAEAEAPILWPPDAKSWLIGKHPDAGKDWRQKEKGTTEDEMIRWHHQLRGHEFEQILRDSEGQGSLVWCSPWGCKESEWLCEWTTKTTYQQNIGKLPLQAEWSVLELVNFWVTQSWVFFFFILFFSIYFY